MAARPVIWSVAGVDSGGGAGLSADQRAADAAGVHLCGIVAAVTAQSSVAVSRVDALAPGLLQAQLDTLATDLAPQVLKTGLLGSVDNLRLLCRWVDDWRRHRPLALVVDPVLRASSGAALADARLLAAYRDELLPRATVLTPNRREAAALLGQHEVRTADLPAQATALQALGPATVCITGGDAADDVLALDWLLSPQATGWLSLPRRHSRHGHGTGCCFATGVAAALARGFPAADAVIIAKMLTTSGLAVEGAPPGAGPGPVRPQPGFIEDPALLPRLSVDARPPAAWPGLTAKPPVSPGLYAIVDDPRRAVALFQAGVSTVQLRLKRGAAEQDWPARLEQAIRLAAPAAEAAGAQLVVNDHWREALALGVRALHLGQEDLLALSPEARHTLQVAQAQGVQLGLSSHSLWELCRALALAPALVACGPVWPTLSKAMPWRAQGLRNLAWWVHMSPVPVVGIGGVLSPEQLTLLAATGAAGGCVLRGVQAGSATSLSDWLSAWQQGRSAMTRNPSPGWPQPSLATPARWPGASEGSADGPQASG